MTPDKDGPILALVVAVAENGVIGTDGDLAWRIADDLRWFKRVTLGKPILMGRKTFDSIGKPLPGRDNIVVSRRSGLSIEGARVAPSVEEGLRIAADCAETANAVEICVIGGAEIYRQTLPIADRIYFTRVRASVEGDVRFPDADWGAWRKIRVGRAARSERNMFSCEFFILDRLCAAT